MAAAEQNPLASLQTARWPSLPEGDPRETQLPGELTPCNAERSAQGERSPSERSQSENARLFALAVCEAKTWKLGAVLGGAAGLEERRKLIERSLRSAVQSVKKLEQIEASRRVGAKWLLDNSNLFRLCLQEVREALGSAKELPQIENARSQRLPRAFAAAESFMLAADFDFDGLKFSTFVNGIQEESSLVYAEIGLLRPFAQLAVLERVAKLAGKISADANSEAAGATPPDERPIKSLQVLVATLRCIMDTDWREIFEAVSATGRILSEDPAGAYEGMDAEGRESYCRIVAEFSAKSNWSEAQIARKVVALAVAPHAVSEARARERRSHVGYYLANDGQKILKKAIGARSTIIERVRGIILRWPELFYFIAIEAVTLGVMNQLLSISAARLAGLLVLPLFLLPVLECAVSAVNLLATLVVRPQRLPRLDFSEGIPNDCATIVAVPMLLINEEQVERAARDLEIRFLGNRDANLHFALLTDLPDSNTRFDDHDVLTGLCSELIRALNDKYAHEGRGSFFHFHRPRMFNQAEGVWMGWERKRGKILDFNQLLLGKRDRFTEKVGDLSLLQNVRYVITLDLDTQLPRDAAHKLVGAIAHPLNRAVLNTATNLVVEGYGILQPRVDICTKSAGKSRMSSILSGETGFDIYTRAISDVYQDLFGEGSFTGKGIYEVATFQQVLENRFPSNAILSHDLIEGAYARAGLISDVEVVDDYPSRFSAFSKRKHRWVRGDWQILRWMFPRVPDASGCSVRNPLNVVSRWKILDNLRRSLTEFATFALLVCGWLVLPGKALYWTLATLALIALPSFLHTAIAIVKARRALFSPEFWWNTISDLVSANLRLFFRLTFLCHQSLVTLDAVVRTIIRMTVTHRRMLNWETAAEAEFAAEKTSPVEVYLDWTPLLSLGIAALIAAFRPFDLVVAAPFLLLWASSKSIARWIDKPRRSKRNSVAAGDQAMLRQATLRTWRFFREFSTAEENWLIPDIVQEDAPGIAHRISPTNLGFLLTSRLAAHDLGFTTLPEFIAATGRSFDTFREMPKLNGHLYNWYDTLTLEAVAPRFVSTVDSGNLVCSLWTLKQGCLEAKARKVFDPSLWRGILDHVDLISEILVSAKEQELIEKLDALKHRMAPLAVSATKWLEALPEIEIEVASFEEAALSSNCSSEIKWWAQEMHMRVRKLVELAYDFAPWFSPVYAKLRSDFPIQDGIDPSAMTLESARNVIRSLDQKLRWFASADDVDIESQAAITLLRSALGRSANLCATTSMNLDFIAEDVDEFVAAMDFKFLYNPQRKLLSIGFDADSNRLNEAHYDLLASEARAASFVAIAKGEIPQESWFRLSRSHTIFKSTSVMLSWTGTMFEYLLPGLWMKSYPNTLLDHNQRAALRSQQKYAAAKSIPWGISESSSSVKNPDGFYHYQAYGVPGLALSHDDSGDLVVSPYSSFLGLIVDAASSLKNLRKLKKMGWLGAYGFFESADFTPGKIAATKQFEVVRCWMAHHQGMSIATAASVLCHSSMQRRFHAEPMVGATERVLHERMPRLLKMRPAEIAGAVASTLIGHGRLALRRAQSWGSSPADLTVPVQRAS
ncbi:MAG: glucoamylase family protein [Candidatus Acidiferrales bacterium]|jgi:cyclic beta-1,2-glucan synthetase